MRSRHSAAATDARLPRLPCMPRSVPTRAQHTCCGGGRQKAGEERCGQRTWCCCGYDMQNEQGKTRVACVPGAPHHFSRKLVSFFPSAPAGICHRVCEATKIKMHGS